MNFLFRKPLGGHTFMTTQDPRYIYKVLCGRCGYPVEECDPRCPRCQLELESCPVCREGTHKKAWKVEADKETGQKTCPVCGTDRIPFGGKPLTKVQGSFCRNIYGCRAGGLLLGSNEFAVLRQNASVCPICRHAELTPLDVRIFLHLVSRCLYCHSVFGPLPTPTREDWRGWEADRNWLQSISPDYQEHCILCGRRDTLKRGDETHKAAPAEGEEKPVAAFPKRNDEGRKEDADTVWVAGLGDHDEFEMKPVRMLHYLRVAELGRILILEKDPTRAFQRLFDAWFEPNRMDVPSEFVPVRDVGQILLAGTQDPAIHRILRVRIEKMQSFWGERLPSEGLNYRLTLRDGKPRKA